MKTTLDIADGLFERAKVRAKATGQPLRSLVEEGLRRVLDTPVAPAKPYKLRDDLAVGKGLPPPILSETPDLVELAYGDEIERIMGPQYKQQFEARVRKTGTKTKRR